jgi:acyl-CoA synthetase (AMP-forming)/AMP-acid ligase II
MTAEDLPSTLPALLARIVSARARHDAIATIAETIDYAELDRRSARLARALLAIGAGKGTHIALLAPDGVFWMTAFLAGLRIGAVITLVSTLSTPAELAHILKHSDTQILLATRRFLRHDYGRHLATAFPALAGQTPPMLQVTGAPYLRSIWFDDPFDLEWAGSHDALLDRANVLDERLLASVEEQVTADEDAIIVYTSGSTAQPKAVVHTHWNLTRHPPELVKLFILKPEDRMLPMLPAFWLGGLAMAMQVLSQGATLVYPESPESEAVLAALLQCRANRVNGWGDGLARLRTLAEARGIDVDAIIGLGPFRDRDGTLIPLALQSNILGMSETFAPHSAEPLNERLPMDKPGASGRAVNHYERRVVDSETGLEVPRGMAGELQLRGGALMRGLYKRPRHAVFTADGFYPTGDLVCIDEDDYLTFIARKGDMIKTRAANVSRLEVEAALTAFPEVKMAAVTGLPDENFGQIVAAAVVPAGGQPDAESLRQRLRETLSSYKVPRRIVFVTEADIPRTATGKLKLHELEQLISSRDGY